MVTIATIVACLLLAGLAVFQVVLALGAPLGRFAWGGQHRVLPKSLRLGSMISVVIYALIAAVLGVRAELISVGLPTSAAQVLGWVVVGYFVLGIGMNLASRSAPERLVMTPLCAVLAVLSGMVALG